MSGATQAEINSFANDVCSEPLHTCTDEATNVQMVVVSSLIKLFDIFHHYSAWLLRMPLLAALCIASPR